MDRFLLDTDKVVASIVGIAADFEEVDTEKLLLAQIEAEERGESFQTLEHLGQQGVSDGTVQAITTAFETVDDGEKLLYPDALPYLDYLDTQGMPNFIMTYGPRPWQLSKLRASTLAGRNYLITDDKYKSELIADSRDRLTGSYSFQLTSGGMIVARTVSLGCDKADSFIGLPADCTGFKLERPAEKALTSQQGELPPNVMVIRALSELMAA
jgi:hypothetical protein